MLEYQKCSMHAKYCLHLQEPCKYYNNDLTRARDATKQRAKCTTIPVYQNTYN